MSSSQSKQADDDIIREITPEDPVFGYLHGEPADPAKREEYQKRSQYFEDAFAVREPYNSPRNRVNMEAVIIVEIKVDVLVKPHQRMELLSVLSARLAEIFQRPENSILVTLEPDAGIRFGGVPDPAYLITVSALASMFAPLTNVHTTAMLQSEMRDVLAIPDNRGVVRYVPIKEENLATGGTTMKAAIEELERAAKAEHPGVVKNLSRSMSKRLLRSKRSNSSPGVLPTLPETPVPAITETAETTETTETAKSVGTPAPPAPANKPDQQKESSFAKRARSIRQFFSH
ncbi:hypothetical protein VTN96DRAFT_7317 [Rasamsonia emersonii]